MFFLLSLLDCCIDRLGTLNEKRTFKLFMFILEKLVLFT